MPVLNQGTRFSGFEIEGVIGEGGMGVVYRARQLATDKLRALKVMQPNLARDAKARQRFVREARVDAKIESDHVVEVVDTGVDQESGSPWIAMELLEGETLEERLKREGALEPSEVLWVMRQLTHALRAAHKAMLVHRDLKPENLFLAKAHRADSERVLKVLDFGIAKWMSQAGTKGSMNMGTPFWIAPEQTKTDATIQPATDLWAVGLLAFKMLTGKDYWASARLSHTDANAFLREMLVDDLLPASERAEQLGVEELLPEGFDRWFSLCVDRDPDARYQTAEECLTELEEVLNPAHAGPATISFEEAEKKAAQAAAKEKKRAEEARKAEEEARAKEQAKLRARSLATRAALIAAIGVAGAGGFYGRGALEPENPDTAGAMRSGGNEAHDPGEARSETPPGRTAAGSSPGPAAGGDGAHTPRDPEPPSDPDDEGSPEEPPPIEAPTRRAPCPRGMLRVTPPPQANGEIQSDFCISEYPISNRQSIDFIAQSDNSDLTEICISSADEMRDTYAAVVSHQTAEIYCDTMVSSTRAHARGRLPRNEEWIFARGQIQSRGSYEWVANPNPRLTRIRDNSSHTSDNRTAPHNQTTFRCVVQVDAPEEGAPEGGPSESEAPVGDTEEEPIAPQPEPAPAEQPASTSSGSPPSRTGSGSRTRPGRSN